MKRLLFAALFAASFSACSCGDEATVIPTIISFTATPASVAKGGTVTLAWNVTDATSITITADPGGALPASTLATGSVTSGAINDVTAFEDDRRSSDDRRSTVDHQLRGEPGGDPAR